MRPFIVLHVVISANGATKALYTITNFIGIGNVVLNN